jgi:hypothetical protein
MRNALIADPHLTGKNADEYRWELFPIVTEMIIKHDIDNIFLMGDLTDAKDNHPAQLVNRIVDGLAQWSDALAQYGSGKLYILAGNHDGIDPTCPYFRFTRNLPNVVYIHLPTYMTSLDGADYLLLPHTRDPIKDWADLDPKGKIVYAHITVNDAIAESMQKLTSSVTSDIFRTSAIAFSGDIHKPQTVYYSGEDWDVPGTRGLIYVGCPYNVRFNDNFTGNIVIHDDVSQHWERVELPQFPKRITFDAWNIADLRQQVDLQTATGRVQAKLRLHVDQSTAGTYREFADQAKELLISCGVELHGLIPVMEHHKNEPVDPTAVREYRVTTYDEFCQEKQFSAEFIKAGRDIMERAV